MEEIRTIRNNFLLQTDKYIISDYPISTEQKNSILNYRQQIRDLPQNLNNIEINLNNIGSYFPQAPVVLVNPFY